MKTIYRLAALLLLLAPAILRSGTLHRRPSLAGLTDPGEAHADGRLSHQPAAILQAHSRGPETKWDDHGLQALPKRN